MKRKIVISLLILFLISASGAALATFNIASTTATLSRLVTLHQIEDLRHHLIISIQSVQSDLYTMHTMLGHKVDSVVDHVSHLEEAARTCGSCHHEPEVAKKIEAVQNMMEKYQDALSYYITASADKQRIDRLKSDAAAIGNTILGMTEDMSVKATQKIDNTTRDAMTQIARARFILFGTMAATFILGALVAVNLTRSITQPINALVGATRTVAAGDLSHTIEVRDQTEFGELAKNFNRMIAVLKESYAKLEREVAERRETEDALRESEERYALAARGANDGLWDWNVKTNTVYYSIRWKSMLGYPEPEVGSGLWEWVDRIHADDRNRFEAKIAAHLGSQDPHFECEYRIRQKGGVFRWVLCRGISVRDENGKVYRMAGSQTDITARKAAEEQLLYDAFHDALTGLPNRALFMDRLQHVIANSTRHPDQLYAVLFLDLDRFKVINDSLGHVVGDKLLAEVGHSLRVSLRPGDTVARLGGDEFAILLEKIDNEGDAADVAMRIQHAFSVPFTIDGHEVYASQSIGIAMKSPLYERPEQILRDADIAMYQAKAKGKSRFEFFDTTMHAGILDRLQLEADLRRAVEHHEGFVLHYQPIMDLKHHRLVGFEALVRWNHPSRGLIFPLEFIPLAEETGMILPLSELIIREACSQLRIWQAQYNATPPLKMSLNVSGIQFLQAGFADRLIETLGEFSIDPATLAIEITESMIMEHTETAVATMVRLQSLGIHIHIDDFGTGYSSLSYLHHFPVNALKIDKTFISKMLLNDENREIVKTIITLAQNLKMDVIAEGVEEAEQLLGITNMECRYGQGYLFSHPLPPEAMDAWMKTGNISI